MQNAVNDTKKKKNVYLIDYSVSKVLFSVKSLQHNGACVM